MKKLILIFTLILISSLITFAQPPIKSYQIKGIVADSISGKGLPYVTISIQSGSQGIIKRLASDAGGKFDFALNMPGKYNVIFQSVGYQNLKQEITLEGEKSKIDLGTVKINPGMQEIDEVSVVAQKPLVRTEVDKIVYSTEVDPEAKNDQCARNAAEGTACHR